MINFCHLVASVQITTRSPCREKHLYLSSCHFGSKFKIQPVMQFPRPRMPVANEGIEGRPYKIWKPPDGHCYWPFLTFVFVWKYHETTAANWERYIGSILRYEMGGAANLQNISEFFWDVVDLLGLHLRLRYKWIGTLLSYFVRLLVFKESNIWSYQGL